MAGNAQTNNAQTIIDMDAARMRATVARDTGALAAMLHDDLVYTHSSARLDTKQSLLGAMESGATVYTDLTASDVKAQDFGDTVILTGAARIAVTSNGVPMAFSVRFTDVYVRTAGDWRMVNWHSTRLRG